MKTIKISVFLLVFTFIFACKGTSEVKTDNVKTEKKERNTTLDKIPINELPIEIYLGERDVKSNLKTDTLSKVDFEKCFMPVEKFVSQESDYRFERIQNEMMMLGAIGSNQFEVFKFKTKSGIDVAGLYFPSGFRSVFLTVLDENMNRIGKMIQLNSGYNERTGDLGDDISIRYDIAAG